MGRIIYPNNMAQSVFTHLALHVPDQAACIDFYERYCGMGIVHDRNDNGKRVVWLAEPGREKELIIVVMGGGPKLTQGDTDYAHLGFAVESKAIVDELAAQAKTEGRLRWPAVQEPYPIGYYCGIEDPGGNIVEFSYGQPLGPGAPE